MYFLELGHRQTVALSSELLIWRSHLCSLEHSGDAACPVIGSMDLLRYYFFFFLEEFCPMHSFCYSLHYLHFLLLKYYMPFEPLCSNEQRLLVLGQCVLLLIGGGLKFHSRDVGLLHLRLYYLFLGFQIQKLLKHHQLFVEIVLPHIHELAFHYY